MADADDLSQFLAPVEGCALCLTMKAKCPEHLLLRLHRDKFSLPTASDDLGSKVICDWAAEDIWSRIIGRRKSIAVIRPEPYGSLARFSPDDIVVIVRRKYALDEIYPSTRVGRDYGVRVITHVQRNILGLMPNFALLQLAPIDSSHVEADDKRAFNERLRQGALILRTTSAPVYCYDLHPNNHKE